MRLSNNTSARLDSRAPGLLHFGAICNTLYRIDNFDILVDYNGDLCAKLDKNGRLYEYPKGCSSFALATDIDFEWRNYPAEAGPGYQYIGNAKKVIIPKKINGEVITSYQRMFFETDVDTAIAQDSSSVKNMRNMFRGSQAVNLDLSNLKASSVVDMRGMFSHSTSSALLGFPLITQTLNKTQSIEITITSSIKANPFWFS